MASKAVVTSNLSKTLIDGLPELDKDFLKSVANALANDLDSMRQEGVLAKGSLLLRTWDIPWVAQELARLRRAAGRTQKDVAKVLDLSQNAIIRRESGVVSFKLHEVVPLARFYGVTDQALITELQQALRKKK